MIHNDMKTYLNYIILYSPSFDIVLQFLYCNITVILHILHTLHITYIHIL